MPLRMPEPGATRMDRPPDPLLGMLLHHHFVPFAQEPAHPAPRPN